MKAGEWIKLGDLPQDSLEFEATIKELAHLYRHMISHENGNVTLWVRKRIKLMNRKGEIFVRTEPE